MDHGHRRGRAEVLVHGRDEGVGQVLGIEVALAGLLNQRNRGRAGTLEERLDPPEAHGCLVERLERELDVRAVVGGDHVEPQLDAAHALEHLGHEQRVAERLAHLLAGGRDPGVVQPVGRERHPGRARLGLLVLVVREAQVDATAVDVEGRAEVLRRHRGALDVPAGTARTPWRGPGGRLGLGLLGALPQREVARVALATRIGVGRGLHVVEALTRQLAVGRPRAHVEVDVPGAVLADVGVAARDERLDQLDHLGDGAGRAGFVRRRQHVDGGERGRQLGVHRVGEVVPGPVLLGGLGEDLVVDVRDVADEVDGIPARHQPAAEHVEVDGRAHVSDVRLGLHGESTDVDPRLPLLEGDEVADLTGRGVVEPQPALLLLCHPPSLGARRAIPDSPKRPLPGDSGGGGVEALPEAGLSAR